MSLFRVRMSAAVMLFVFLTVAAATAQQARQPESDYKLSARAEREDAVYQKGEKVLFRIQLTEKGKPLSKQKIQYNITGDGGYLKKGTVESSDSRVELEASLDRPGFLKCDVHWQDGQGNKASGIAGAAVAPLEIRPARPEPTDFDAFWTARKKELDDLPIEAALQKVDAGKQAKPNVEVFDVKVNCTGGKSMSGYFAKPTEATPKSLPIIVSYHGAGVSSARMPIWEAEKGALALDINAHGLENGKPAEWYADLYKGPMKNYRWENLDNRDKQYFVGMFQRVYRSLQFMKAQPEWDGKTIVVKGGSQGGGQALAAAGLDPDVTFCQAFVPAICYHTGYLDKEFGGWPGFLKGNIPSQVDPAVIETVVPYVDAASLAKRIKAECVLTVGFVDYVCSPTSVYVAYNNISSQKQILTMPEQGHNTPKPEADAANKLLWEHIEKRRVK